MTTSSIKPTTRITSAYIRERGLRPVIATITGSCIELRLKGLRSREVLDVASLYHQAVKARVLSEQAARRAKRRAKR